MKRIICLLLVLLLFCACVPTPVEEFIISKSDTSAEQKINEASLTEETITAQGASENDSTEPALRTQSFPDRWDEDEYPIREFATLSIHTDVETKADGLYPVYRTRGETLTSEDVIAVMEQLLGKPKEMRYLDARTKEDWGRELKEYVDTVAEWQAWVDAGRPEIEGHDDTDYTPEEIEKTTAWYMEQINGAPEKIETQKVSDFKGYRINEFVSFTLEDGRSASVTAYNNAAWCNYLHISKGCESLGYLYYAHQHEEDEKPGADASMKKTAALWKETTLSREEAEAIAYRELEKLGFSDFRVARAEKAILLDVREGAANRYTATGWGLLLQRDFGGYPLLDVKYQASELLNYGDDDTFAVNEPIYAEKIELFVDENGIESFSYSSPKSVTGLANANVELLPFSEIQRIVKNMLSVCYPVERYQGSENRQWHLEVYRMVLTTYTLHMRDSDAYYEMPCWIVLFDGWFSSENRDNPNMRQDGIVINAIDGTVVHSKAGY